MIRPTISEKMIIDGIFDIAKMYQSRGHKLSLKNTIVFLRKRLRMSQKTLAKRAKVPVATLSRIESGKVRPGLKTLEKIFKALFCDWVILPLPEEELDKIVQTRIRHIAEKRVRYLKGTMALELQQPQEEMMQELTQQEMRELESKKSDIWGD